jgi:hypothetical protein
MIFGSLLQNDSTMLVPLPESTITLNNNKYSQSLTNYNEEENNPLTLKIIVETNNQVIAYLTNDIHFAMLQLFIDIHIKMPNMSVFEYDELGNLSPNYFSPAANVQGQYSRIYNPVAMAAKAKYNVLGERIVPRFQMNYDIIKKVLKATFDVQFDINNTKNQSFLPQIATGRPNIETVVNRAYDGDIDLFSVSTKSNLVYTPQLKNRNHSFVSFLSILTNDYKALSQELMTSNTASSLLTDPSNASRTQNEELRAISNTTETRSVGAVVSAQYSYKDKYIINAGLRGDGNSRFGPNYKYGLFPSVSMRWRVSGEKYFEKFKNLDDLSLRASYGQSGEAPRYDYTFYNRYSTYNWSYLGQSGVYPATMELKNLRWQTIHGSNLGACRCIWADPPFPAP